MFALGLEGVDRQEGTLCRLSSLRRRKQAADRERRGRGSEGEREELCPGGGLCQLPAVPRLKSAWRKQDVKDFQTPTRPLTER